MRPLRRSDRRAEGVAQRPTVSPVLSVSGEMSDESITIGPLTISRWPDGTLWIAREGGEGMQTSDEKLLAALEAFWAQEF